MGQLLLVHGHAGVSHTQQQSAVGQTQLAAQADTPAGGAVLDSIAQQVDQHLAQAQLVGVDAQLRLLQSRIGGDRDVGALRLRLQQFERAAQDLGQEYRTQPHRQASLDTGNVEHVFDEGQQMPACIEDRFDLVALRLRGFAGQHRRIMQQLGDAEHRVQGRAQFVVHARKEFGLGQVRCGRCGDFCLRGLSRALQALRFGHVAINEKHARLAFLDHAAGRGDAVDRLPILAAPGQHHRIGATLLDEFGPEAVALRQVAPDFHRRRAAADDLLPAVNPSIA